MKKYILPLFFAVMIFILIPKEAYYKKEDMTIKISTTEGNWKGRLYQNFYTQYNGKKASKALNWNDKIEIKLKNMLHLDYKFNLASDSGEIREVQFKSADKIKKIENIEGNNFSISSKNLKELYSFSFLNMIIYLTAGVSLIIYYFKNGLELTNKKIGIICLSLIFLSISLNLKWFNKLNGLFISLTFFKLLLEKKKIKFGYFEIGTVILVALSMLSEYYNFMNYEKAYDYFQNTLLVLLCVKIWDFDYNDKNDLKKLMKTSLIVSGLINLVSPLALTGIYMFTFGSLMTILLCVSIEEIIYYEKKTSSLIINLFGFMLGLYGLIASERRTMMVALVIYLIYIFLMMLKRSLKKSLKLLAVFLLISALIVQIGFKSEVEKIRETIVSIANIKTNGSNIQRLMMWRRGYYIAKENPVIGIGVDSFYKEAMKAKYDVIKDEREEFIPEFIHVHNEYLHQIITRGFIGAFIFFGIWTFILKEIRKTKDFSFDIMLLILYLIYGIFDPYSIRAESMIFYTFIGITLNNCTAIELKNKKSEKNLKNMLGYISLVMIFLLGTFFNKRFRYYFLITALSYLIYYILKKRKRVIYERI